MTMYAKNTSSQLYEAEYIFSFNIMLWKGLKNRKLQCLRFDLCKIEDILNIDYIMSYIYR